MISVAQTRFYDVSQKQGPKDPRFGQGYNVVFNKGWQNYFFYSQQDKNLSVFPNLS